MKLDDFWPLIPAGVLCLFSWVIFEACTAKPVPVINPTPEQEKLAHTLIAKVTGTKLGYSVYYLVYADGHSVEVLLGEYVLAKIPEALQTLPAEAK